VRSSPAARRELFVGMEVEVKVSDPDIATALVTAV
jgi:hypothetical protein